MKEITLKVPDTKIHFVLELFKQLGLEVKEKDTHIPEEHKNIVLNRIKNTKEEDLLDWDDVKDDFDGTKS